MTVQTAVPERDWPGEVPEMRACPGIEHARAAVLRTRAFAPHAHQGTFVLQKWLGVQRIPRQVPKRQRAGYLQDLPRWKISGERGREPL